MTSKIKNDRHTGDKFIVEFDKLLDELDQPPTRRTNVSNHKTPSPSNTFQQQFGTTRINQSVNTKQTSEMFDLDDILYDMEAPSVQLSERVKSSYKEPIKLDGFRCWYEHKGSWMEFFSQKKFCDDLKEEIQKRYSVNITITKKNDISLGTVIYTIEFEGAEENKVNEAKNALEDLFKHVAIKLVDDPFGFWVRYPVCIRIVQAYSDQTEHLHLLYEHGTLGLMITYFDKDKSPVLINLCTNDMTLTKTLREKFLSLDVVLPNNSDLTKENKSHLAQDILKLQNQMESQSILMVLEQRCIRLFGFIDLVRSVEKELEEIKGKHISNTVKLTLEPSQIEYLLDVYRDELKALENTYQNAKIIDSLRQGKFSAPTYLHETIEKQILSMAVLSSPICFDIEQEAFSITAHDQRSNLIKIGHQNKCQIEIQEIVNHRTVEIPKATAQDHVSNKLTAAAIEIRVGDLADQKVDLVVVCSTSLYLCQDILNKAGRITQEEFARVQENTTSEFLEINAGDLKCRKLLFLPWKMNRTSTHAFYQSIREFVAKAVEYGIKAHHTSIAFPSIGCGQLNFDKNIIANEMLVEAQKQLLVANVLLQIIFVILPTKTDVFQTFQSKLDMLQKEKIDKKDDQLSYKLTTLKITVKSSSIEKQEQCRKDIDDHVQKSTSATEYLQQDVLKKWTQPALNELFQFSFKQNVLIDMNIQIGYMKFSGSKESVSEVEKEYYRIQANQSEQARLSAIARNIIWAYQIDLNTSEKYPPELNARIEDAFSSRNPSFDYMDNLGDQYKILFETMMETCETKQIQRRVIRHADFHLPEYWDVQMDNVKRFSVKIDSDEFRGIHALFDKTMAGMYMTIIRIERIQNKPWYMQYNSYKSFSSKKDTERKLFHGCPQQSADLIIHSFFNRSFAGINGVVYGQGAYFSANANYSHGYAKANTDNGERHMFVANVLIGDTTRGNQNMKTPPHGFDSTTDGNHIFVTYRDDQAYAAYLIVYK